MGAATVTSVGAMATLASALVPGAGIALVIATLFFAACLIDLRLALGGLAAASVSLQYLEVVQLGSVSALWLAGAFVPAALLFGLAIRSAAPPRGALIWFLAYLAVGFVATLYMSGRLVGLAVAFGQWAKVVNAFVVLLVAAHVVNDMHDVEFLVSCSLAALALPGSVAVYQLATGDLTPYWKGARYVIDSYYHHPGVIAFALTFTFPLVLYRISAERHRIGWYAIGLTWLALVFFTYRRSVWITVAGQIMLWMVMRRRGRLLLLLLLATVAFIISNGATRALFVERFGLLADLRNVLHDPGALFRSQYLNLLLNRWGIYRAVLIGWFGAGPIAWMIGAGPAASLAFTSASGLPPMGPHSVFLMLLVETGVIGFAMFTCVIVAIVRHTLRLLRDRQAQVRLFADSYLVLLGTFLLLGSANHLLLELSSGIWIFWILTGAVLALDGRGEPLEPDTDRTSPGPVRTGLPN